MARELFFYTTNMIARNNPVTSLWKPSLSKEGQSEAAMPSFTKQWHMQSGSSAKSSTERKPKLLEEPGSGEIDADGAADHVESRHGFDR